MTKRQKFLFGTTIILVTSTLPVISCAKEDFLVGRGSNSTSPITGLISRKTVFNLIYSPDGSTFGARAMARQNIAIDFGMASSRKAPGTLGGVDGIDYSNDATGKAQEITNWNNNKVRTLTFAIDAIGVGLNLPSSIKSALGDNKPLVDFDNLSKIYSLAQNNDMFPTWKEFLLNPEVQALNNDQANSKPLALAIEGGVSTSGKAEAFLDKISTSTWFQANKDNLNIPAIRNHDPAIIPLDQQVADREQEMYSKNNNTNGSVMYYSLGYIIKNDNDAKVTLASISQDGSPWGLPTIDNAQNGTYPWIRPFNIIYPTTNNEVAVKNNSLIATILTNEFQMLIGDLGFVPLSSSQIQLQSITFALTDPDQTLNTDDPTNFDYGLKL